MYKTFACQNIWMILNQRKLYVQNIYGHKIHPTKMHGGIKRSLFVELLCHLFEHIVLHVDQMIYRNVLTIVKLVKNTKISP